MSRNDRDSALEVSKTDSRQVGSTETNAQFDLMAMLKRVKRRKRSMMAVTGVVFILGMAYSMLQRPDYESKATLLVSSNNGPGLAAMSGVPLPSEMQNMLGQSSVETETEVISDDQLLQSAYERLSPSERKIGFCGEKKLPKWAVKAKPKHATDVLEITVLSHSPKISAHLANTIVDVYFDRDFNQSNKTTRKARRYAATKMQVLSKQLSEASKKLADYKRKNHVVSLDTQMDKFAEYMTTLQGQLDTVTADHAAGQKGLASMERQILKERPDVVSGNVIKQNPRFAATALAIDQLYGKRAEMLQEFTPKSPEIKSLDAEIKDQENRLKKTTETIIDSEMHSRNPIRDSLLTAYTAAIAKEASDAASISVLQQKLDEQKKTADTLPDKERNLLELQGKVSLLQRAYGVVSDQYYNLLLSEQQNAPRAQIISSAIPDKDKVSPHHVRDAAVFLVLGVLVALGVAIVQDSRDGRVHERADAEQASGYFASAVVPQAPMGTSPLIAQGGPRNGLLESFRILRNGIYFAGAEARLKTLAVTSPRPGEGKTVTCANLAAAMVMDGKSVVMVDCNMEHPDVRNFIRKSYDSGLTNALSGECDVERAIAAGEQTGLYLIPSGPMVLNFPEMINSQRGRKVFAQLADRFDYVLLDCPSSENLGDLQMITTVADGVVLVAKLDKTMASDLEEITEMLSRVGAPVVGFVVNGDPEQVVRDSSVRGGGIDNELRTGKVKTQPKA